MRPDTKCVKQLLVPSSVSYAHSGEVIRGARALSRTNDDEFVPQTQHVDLRMVV